MRGLLALAMLASLLWIGSAWAGTTGRSVMLVVRLDGKSIQTDRAIQQHLADRGYAVTLSDQYAGAGKARDFDLVVISSSVRSRDLLGAFRDVSVPVVTWESDILDDMGMSGKRPDTDFGKIDKQHALWLVNAPHPLAAGLPPGIVNVYIKNAPFNWGKPGLGAVTIATVAGEPEKAAIFGYEKGATMDYESLAPARRVMLFLDNDTFSNLTPEGIKLFDAAIDWSVHKPSP